jgi:putative spermidine/putrescine transport system ATP-binding protein
MRDGRSEQVAAPDMLYREPATPFVAGFIGTMNLIEGAVQNGTFKRPGFTATLPVSDGPATFAVRPEALGITAAFGDGSAKIHRVTDYGTHAIVDLDLPDDLRLKSLVPDARAWKAGQGVDLAPRAFAAYRDNAAIYRSGTAQ